MIRTYAKSGLLFAAAALGLAATPAMAEETVVRAQVSLAQNNLFAVNWIKNYLPRINEAGKGVVKVDFVGGEEVTPGRKAGLALKRGVFDMLYGPPAYYLGQVPEAYALTISSVTPAEARKNGGYALLDKIWMKRLNAKVIAWGDSEIRYNLYMTKKPNITKTGDIDLPGIKMRSTGTYRPIILGLGGTPVAMPASEIYTGLQRGVVNGFGFPAVGVKPLGVVPVLKYRINPPFYRLQNLLLVNADV